MTLYSVASKRGRIYGYEVAILKIAKATPPREINGKCIPEIPERELYPGNEDFGVNGWYYQRCQDAERRYEESLSANMLSASKCRY